MANLIWPDVVISLTGKEAIGFNQENQLGVLILIVDPC
jgi:hypothetical protein